MTQQRQKAARTLVRSTPTCRPPTHTSARVKTRSWNDVRVMSASPQTMGTKRTSRYFALVPNSEVSAYDFSRSRGTT